jgi:hypothetical protein
MLGSFLGSSNPLENLSAPTEDGLVSEQLWEFDKFDGALEHGRRDSLLCPSVKWTFLGVSLEK